MRCMDYQMVDGDWYECVKDWHHDGAHDFQKVKKIVVKNLDLDGDILGEIRDDVNACSPRYHYTTEAIRQAVFKLVSAHVEDILTDLAWEWKKHNGAEGYLGDPDIDLGPLEFDAQRWEADPC